MSNLNIKVSTDAWPTIDFIKYLYECGYEFRYSYHDNYDYITMDENDMSVDKVCKDLTRMGIGDYHVDVDFGNIPGRAAR